MRTCYQGSSSLRVVRGGPIRLRTLLVRTTAPTVIRAMLLRPHARLGVCHTSPLPLKCVHRVPAKVERALFPGMSRDLLRGRSALRVVELRRRGFIYVSCYPILHFGAGVARIGARGY